MTSNLISTFIPVGIGYDSDGNAKGLIELSSITVSSITLLGEEEGGGEDGGGISVDERFLSHVTISDRVSYPVSSSDRVIYVSGLTSVVLPKTNLSDGRVLDICNIATLTVTVTPTSGDTINGNTSVALSSKYDSVTVHSNGTEWFIL